MRTKLVVLVAGIAFVATNAAAAKPAPPPGPDLKQCGKYTPQEGDQELERKGPLPLPAALRPLIAANRDYVAVKTQTGATFCLFAHEWESIDPPSLSADGRLLGFGWYGYEAGGYILVDRAGKGAKFETGAKPVPTPSGRRLASLEWSESGFGSLNGVLVLEIGPGALRELARITEMPEGLTDWRFDRWRGENCVEISALRYSAPDKALRAKFSIRPKGATWALVKAACPAA